MTLLEVMVVIFSLTIIVVLLIPVLAIPRQKQSRLNCVNNLKEISLSFRIWEGDNNNDYPMAVSCTNGGALEQVMTGDVARVFLVLSNEISTPKILVCPMDKGHFRSTNFSSGFSASNVSYFVGVNATEKDPQMLLSGDDNFEIAGVPVKSGILDLTTNPTLAWSDTRHKLVGNVALTDGSVQQFNTKALQDGIKLATNRIAIP